jgi:hypothetical protein
MTPTTAKATGPYCKKPPKNFALIVIKNKLYSPELREGRSESAITQALTPAPKH